VRMINPRRLSVTGMMAHAAGLACLFQCVSGGDVMARQMQPREHPDLTRIIATKQFAFNGKFIGSAGLSFGFSRPVSTVDPQSVVVAPDRPRFEDTTALAGAPVFESVRSSPDSSTSILGSGLDHDGVTPLMVVLENPANPSLPRLLDVFSVGGDDLLKAEATGEGRVRTVLPASSDLMGGTIFGKAYRPTSCAVCHGLIVVYCTVRRLDGAQQWRDVAGAFVVSQDRGQTWQLVFESQEFSPGWTRGAPWSMQNWWPMERNAPPKQGYFVASDYCLNPGAPGGHTVMFRATRPNAGEAWTCEPGRVLYRTTAVEHHHTGGIVPFGLNGGLRAFSVIGDVRQRNRIVSFTRNNDNYLAKDWFVQENYHGAAGLPGVEGNQFVGCAPGPYRNSVIAGSDLTSEQLMLLEFDDAAPSHPRTSHLYGNIAANGAGNFNFVVRTPTPELGGPYCANYNSSSSSLSPFDWRTLLSDDGLHWAQGAAQGGGYQVIHAGHLYFDGGIGDGMRRTVMPPIKVGRPLLIGPGGWQRQRADARVESNGRLVPLVRDKKGRWLDSGVPLDPQPPCLGSVYRLTTQSGDPERTIGYIYPISSGFSAGPMIWPQTQLRWWVMSQDNSLTASINVGAGLTGTAPDTYRMSLISATRNWTSVDATYFSVPIPGTQPYLVFSAADTVCESQVLYVAMDSFAEGRGFPGYPMRPGSEPLPSPPVHAGTPFPDELATISGLMCWPDWTITLAVQLPENGVDDSTTEQTRWPIATLWGDDQNFVEITADFIRNTLVTTYTANGVASATNQAITSDTLLFMRGSPILLSLAHRGSDGRLEMTMSAGAQSVHTRGVTPPANRRLLTQPRQIRFYQQGAPASSSGIAARVMPLQVWGGQVDERRFLQAPARIELLQRLGFLDGIRR